MFFRKPQCSIYAFLFIVLCAALFRITNLDLIEFKADEASNLLISLQPILGKPFPYGGILSSTGVLNFPLFNYILIPILLISKNPMVIVFIIASVNSLAIGFLFLLIKKYYNYQLAFITTLLMAFSPWAIIFSRKIWPPDLVLPFLVVLLFSIHKIVIDKKTVFFIPYIIFSLILIQLELPFVLFVSLVFIFLLLSSPRINIKYIFIGLIIGLIPIFLYFRYEIKNNCPDCSRLSILDKEFPRKHSVLVFVRPLQIMSQGNFRFILGDDTLTFANKYPLTYRLRPIFYVEYLLLPLGIFIFWKLYRKLRFLVYSTILLPVLYFILRAEPFMHYFIIFFPLLFIFLGLSFYSLLRSKNKLLTLMSAILLILLIIESINFNSSFFKLLGEQKKLKGDYGTSLGESRRIAENYLNKYKNDKNYDEIIMTNYIPMHLMRGTSAFAKMIYPYENTKKNLTLLEKQLKEFPDDPRVLRELLSYYTTANPTKETVDFLKKKNLSIPAYSPIYSDVYYLYLQQNYKKNYKSNVLPFSFEYPEHWIFIDNNKKNKVQTTNGVYSMTIEKILSDMITSIEFIEDTAGLDRTYFSKEIKVLGNNIKRTECYQKNLWCGIWYSPFQIDDYYYKIKYSTKNPVPRSRDLKDVISIMDNIVNSFQQ